MTAKNTNQKANKPQTKKVAAKCVLNKSRGMATDHRHFRVTQQCDGKWAVEHALSEKVIKLFPTKIEALRYARRMEERCFKPALSHCSKGFNKGKIGKARLSSGRPSIRPNPYPVGPVDDTDDNKK